MFFFIDKPSKNAEYPYFVLVKDTWDDFGSKTLFKMSYYEDEQNKTDFNIKIMDKETANTLLKEKIYEELPENFCSLGQNLSYYEEFRKINNYEKILRSLNDVVLNVDLKETFEHEPTFRNSLIRFPEAEKALKYGRKILNGINIGDENIEFTFSCKINSFNQNHSIKFDFTKNDYLPYRISCLIGKNGVGKTRYLSNLADYLSMQKINKKDELELIGKRFFNRIIAVSYSIFDNFTRPNAKQIFSYKYIGIKDSKGIKSNINIIKSYLDSLTILHTDPVKFSFWKQIIRRLLDCDEEFIKQLLNVTVEEGLMLSAGTSMLVCILTEILAYISEETLLIFDEPETHTHPNATLNLIHIIYDILEEYNSYAIIATHSPIIIQEIPSKYVHIIERIGDIPYIRKLDIESFGENLSTITSHIFNTPNIDQIHKKYFDKMATLKTYDENLQIFDNKLSLNAKLYLASKYS